MDTTSIQRLQDTAPAGSASATPPVSVPEQELEVWFGYRIGSHRFVLDKSLLTEIVIRPAIYEIPKSPAWLAGVMNLRGNILAVVDLSDSLRTVCKSNPGEFVLVIDKGSDALALIVDAPPISLTNPTPVQSLSEPNSLNSDFIRPGVQADNVAWLHLDAKGLARSLRANT
jgi:chemotaxis signal transduction protein